MRSLAALLLLVLGTLPAAGAEPADPITKAAVLKAIATFRREPASERGRESAEVILRFANDSPDVLVTLSPQALPWTEETPPPREGRVLLAAFVAGNVRAQLARGAAKDDSLAGVEQVIETYRQLQRANPRLKIPSVEHLIELAERDQLREHLDRGDSV